MEPIREFVIRKLGQGLEFDIVLRADEELWGWRLASCPSLNPADGILCELEAPQSTDLWEEGDLEFGPVIIWDRGGWQADADPHPGFARGKLRFELFGYKLRGIWALGRGKGIPHGRGKPWQISTQWSLSKAPDVWAQTSGPAGLSPLSVVSGLSVDDAAGRARNTEIQSALEHSGAPRKRVSWSSYLKQRMFPGEPVAPFSDEDWLFELHRGGVMVSVSVIRGRTRIVDGSGRAYEKLFPEISESFARMPGGDAAIIEAELVVLDVHGRPDSARLTSRLEATPKTSIREGALQYHATLHAFDLIALNGYDLRNLDLLARKQLLKLCVPSMGPYLYADDVPGNGEALASTAGQSGDAAGCTVMARRTASTYEAGTSDSWRRLTGDSAARGSGNPKSEGGSGDTVRLSNLTKVFWPEDGTTKGDLLEYYRAVAPHMLPFLHERPLVLKRFPDGIHGKSFFQHHAPGAKSSWLRTVRIEGSRRPRDYFVTNDVESLLYLVNLGTIPLHMWSARIETIERPDWCIMDLDRSAASAKKLVQIAHAVHHLLDSLALPSFVKTSGGTGFHVLVPLAGQLDHDASRAFAELIARVIEKEHPKLATTEPNIARRGKRVYLDYMVNARGRMLVAPLSVRALPRAPVSMPLPWDEIDDALKPGAYTVHNVPEKLASWSDPWRGLLELTPDLGQALQQLGELLA